MVIFQVYLQLLDRLLHPYKFHGRDMSGILFFIFASCEPLIFRLSIRRETSLEWHLIYFAWKSISGGNLSGIISSKVGIGMYRKRG